MPGPEPTLRHPAATERSYTPRGDLAPAVQYAAGMLA